MYSLPESFGVFTSLGCNREQFIIDYLEGRGIRTSTITLGDSRHIYAHFAPSAYNPSFKVKTAIAHYDRFPGSPGANDNSAAVWQLMDWAVRLKTYPGMHNVRIIFTDGEELGSDNGVKEIGAFGIAERLKALGITRDDVYVFDCCGRGEVFVISRPLKPGERGLPAAFRKRYNDLVVRTGDLLKKTAPGAWLSLPAPYSDNAGFIAQGIPAVLVTTLPENEAALYARALRQDKALAALVMNNQGAANPGVKEKLPETWRLLHTGLDNDSALTPKTFALMGGLLDAIGDAKSHIE
ncbi:MAG: M28 family peptidase [Spirochaetaceae bacterium]|jgi:hypothetical protein|nr:M28 family peptidase [Spirochaetaceae bacterium]